MGWTHMIVEERVHPRHITEMIVQKLLSVLAVLFEEPSKETVNDDTTVVVAESPVKRRKVGYTKGLGINMLYWLIGEYATEMKEPEWVNVHLSYAPPPRTGRGGGNLTHFYGTGFFSRLVEYIPHEEEYQKLTLRAEEQRRSFGEMFAVYRPYPKRWLLCYGYGLRDVVYRLTNEGKSIHKDWKDVSPMTILFAGSNTNSACIISIDDADPSTGVRWQSPIYSMTASGPDNDVGYMFCDSRGIPTPPSEDSTVSRAEYDSAIGYVAWIKEMRDYQHKHGTRSEDIRLVLIDK